MSDNDTKTFYADAGKGDRPRGTGWKNYYDNFDNIFGNKAVAVAPTDASCMGNLSTSEIGGDWSAVSIDAEGNVVRKESGCNTEVEVVNDVSKADEG
jgi:hypothetical protein